MSTGRYYGIIQAIPFAEIMEMASMLRTSGVWLKKDEDELKSWARAFLSWLLNSDLGKSERAEGMCVDN